MPFNIDTSKVIFFTSAILDPWTMLKIFIKALWEGFRFFIVPERNLQGVLSESVLGYCRITTFTKIHMTLAGSNYALPLICFMIQNDDAFDLITLMQLTMTTQRKTIIKDFNDIKERTNGINLERLVALADKVKKNSEKKVLNISKESKRSKMELPDDRPLPNEYCADLNNFGEALNKYKEYLPTILVDLDIEHKNHELYKQVGAFLSPAFRDPIKKIGFPCRFINEANCCHFNSTFQFHSILVFNAKIDYVNSIYPEICGVIRSYIQGESHISPITLTSLVSRLKSRTLSDYLSYQQDVLETWIKFFGPTLVSPVLPHEVECAKDWRCQSCKVYTCEVCGFREKSITKESDAFFTLHVPPTQVENPMTIDYLFAEYCAETTIQRNCDCCNESCPTTKLIEMIYYPKVLIFCTLNGRFDSEIKNGRMDWKRVKKGAVVSPELIITLPNGKKFKLSTMIYHTGESPMSGHYISAVNYFDDWYLLDDYNIEYKELKKLVQGECDEHLRQKQQHMAEDDDGVDNSGPEYSRYKGKDETPIPTSSWYDGIPLRDGESIPSRGDSKFYVYLLGYTALDADSKEERKLMQKLEEKEAKKKEDEEKLQREDEEDAKKNTKNKKPKIAYHY